MKYLTRLEGVEREFTIERKGGRLVARSGDREQVLDTGDAQPTRPSFDRGAGTRRVDGRESWRGVPLARPRGPGLC